MECGRKDKKYALTKYSTIKYNVFTNMHNKCIHSLITFAVCNEKLCLKQRMYFRRGELRILIIFSYIFTFYLHIIKSYRLQ